MFQKENTAFYARLLTLVDAADSSVDFCWREDVDSVRPTNIAARRMLERLFITYGSSDGTCPTWLSNGVQEYLKREARGALPAAVATRSNQPCDRTYAFKPPFGAGAVRSARVLLVGDRPGRGWLGKQFPHWPFISANTTGASAWLAEQLELFNIGEENLFWINSHTAAQDALDPSHVEALPFFSATLTLIIAFGRNAANWCNEAGWANLEVYNPVHWHKRFADRMYYPAKLIAAHLGEQR